MTALWTKLRRDLFRMGGSGVAIVLVVAAGVSIFVASMSTLDSLTYSRSSFYEESRFSHVFARIERAPLSVADRIALLPGVAEVEARVVGEGLVDLGPGTEPATGRVVGSPGSSAAGLDRIHLRRGRLPEPDRDDEALVSVGFAARRGIEPGDTVHLVLGGHRRSLSITGTAISPEYVYAISGEDPWPDEGRFAIFWVRREAAEAALDMHGAFNSLNLRLEEGASEPAVLAAVDQILEAYGGIPAHGRDRQLSDTFLRGELDQLRGMALFIPLVFLSVAGFLLHVVLGRLVATQRTQIATLKAFGYGDATIAVHYLAMAQALVLAGAAVGVLVGLWLGGRLTSLYTEYFQFPVLTLRVTPSTVLLAVALTVAAATAGVLSSVKRVARLPPAEAMRPEPPATYKATIFERAGLLRLLSPASRMAVRGVSRYPVRTALSTLGIALAVGVLVVGRFTEDAVNTLIDLNFRTIQREDVAVFFRAPVPAAVRGELERMPGVLRAEPFRIVPATLSSENRERVLALTGLAPGGDLRRLIDADGREVPLPAAGLLMTSHLADLLGLRPGDLVRVAWTERHREPVDIPLSAVMEEYVGANAYIELAELRRLLGEEDSISGAYLAVDPRDARAVQERLKRIGGVAGLSLRRSALASFEKNIAESMGVMRSIQFILASIIAFSVVYNAVRVALSERSRELATLRVLGFTRGEVHRVLLGELAMMTAAAIPLGLFLGHWMARGVSTAFATEEFRFPFVIHTSTYAYAALGVLVSAVASAAIARRSIDRLDLVAVLKIRD